MKILLKSPLIIDPSKQTEKDRKDILIENGQIKQIAKSITARSTPHIDCSNKYVSVGWLDMRTFLGDPGYEFKEDLISGQNAALRGGFTDILCLPNTQPVIDSKSQVEYIINKSKGHIVNVHPIGAVTKGTEGHQLCELQDMDNSGAVAFSDGLVPVWHTSVMTKLLQYVQSFNGVILEHAYDKLLCEGGLMNEGVESVKLGLKGIPAIAEVIGVNKIIDLLRYVGGRIHFSCVSTKEAIESIRKAKKEGLQITCDVAAYQMAFIDEELMNFDTNLKVFPPFRSKSDSKAIIKGLKDGTIDAVVSNHTPQDLDSKNLEFDQAEFGIINLETAFSVLYGSLKDQLEIDDIIKLITTSPRKILNMNLPKIKEGEKACLTIFDTTSNWIPDPKSTLSRSKNSPFFGMEMLGKVTAVINNNDIYINE